MTFKVEQKTSSETSDIVNTPSEPLDIEELELNDWKAPIIAVIFE